MNSLIRLNGWIVLENNVNIVKKFLFSLKVYQYADASYSVIRVVLSNLIAHKKIWRKMGKLNVETVWKLLNLIFFIIFQ